MKLPDFLYESLPGEIRPTGHRIGLYSVVRCHKEGLSPEEIVAEFPTLSLEHVGKMIEFAEANRAEVDKYVEEYRQEPVRQEALHSRPEMREKLRKRWG